MHNGEQLEWMYFETVCEAIIERDSCYSLRFQDLLFGVILCVPWTHLFLQSGTILWLNLISTKRVIGFHSKIYGLISNNAFVLPNSVKSQECIRHGPYVHSAVVLLTYSLYNHFHSHFVSHLTNTTIFPPMIALCTFA